VKAAITPGGKATAATPQQIRQLAIHQQLLQQRKLPPQKVAQLTQVRFFSQLLHSVNALETRTSELSLYIYDGPVR